MDGRYWQSGRGFKKAEQNGHNKASGQSNPVKAAILFDAGVNG